MASQIVHEILKAENNADEALKTALLKKEQDIKNAELKAKENAKAAEKRTTEENDRFLKLNREKADGILNNGQRCADEAAKKVKEDCKINREKAIDGILAFLKEC